MPLNSVLQPVEKSISSETGELEGNGNSQDALWSEISCLREGQGTPEISVKTGKATFSAGSLCVTEI